MIRSFTRLAAVLALLAISAPALAAGCQTLTIEGGYITARSPETDAAVLADLSGHYVVGAQIGFDSAAPGAGDGEFSAPLPAADATAVVCSDGSITFSDVGTDPVPVNEGVEIVTDDELAEPDPMSTPVVLDVAPERLPVLHPSGGGVQEF